MDEHTTSSGVHYIKPINAHDGYHELVEGLRPFFSKREFDLVLEECHGPHDDDSLAALALFARHDDECGLQLSLFTQAHRGEPLNAETIDELVALRAERHARTVVDRWLHVLWVYAEAKGQSIIRLADLNDFMLPKLTMKTLVLFTKAPAMRAGLSDGDGNFTDVVDVTMYDGFCRGALSWLRAQLPEGKAVPDALVRIFADHDPPIRLEE